MELYLYELRAKEKKKERKKERKKDTIAVMADR